MSLQFRLPLDGRSLANYGVAPATITGSSVTYTTGGKTAVQCKNAGTVSIASKLITTPSEGFSYSIWWKIGSEDSYSIALPCFNGEGYGTLNFSKVGYTGYQAIKWYFTQSDYYGSSNLKPQLIWLYDTRRGNAADSWTLDTWHHFMITVENETSTTARVKAYVDGVLKANSTTNYIFTLREGTISIAGTALQNDFRLYNHVCSPKEVKLISQGLVAHYLLSEGSLESTTNLAPYPTPGSAPSSSWDASLHTNAITVSNWGYGYNGGVSNPTTGYHACWKIVDGLPTIVFNNLNSIVSVKNRWMGISSSGIQSKLSSSATYTISFDAKGSVEGMTIGSGIYYRLTSGTSNAFHDGIQYTTISTTWKRYSYTKTLNSAFDSSASASIYMYGHYGIEGTSYVRNIQVELKSHTTEYTPSSRTTTTLQDCSGNGYNGTISGSLQISNNSTRNRNCAYFNGSTAVALGRSAMVTDALTVNWWGYMDNWALYASAPMRALSCTEGGGWNFEPASSKMNFACGTGASSNTYKSATGTTTFSSMSAGWHMFTGTYDGYSTKIYVDGKLEGTNSAYTTKTPLYYHASNGIFIGAEAAGSATSPGSPYFTGYLSDVRIYGTALSADDIAILYNTRVSMTKKGELFCNELIEGKSTNLSFCKDGTIESGSLDETMSIFDMPTKVLSDGSAWARINWLNLANDKTVFTGDSEVAKCINATNRYSRMGQVDNFIGKKFTITNLMPAVNTTNYSGGTSSSTFKKYGANSLQVTGTTDTSEVFLYTASTLPYTPGHTYYARAEIIQSTKVGSSDFYWKVAEPYVYGGKAVSAVNTWTMISNVRTAATVIDRNGSDWASGNYQARLDFNNSKTAGNMWFTGMMLIDLTESFGEGFEPTASWCDANIPYFVGSRTIEIDDDSVGFYEFMLTYPLLSTTLYNRWRQNISPNSTYVTSTSGTGYKAITTAWTSYAAPITKSASNGSSVYSCNITGNWWAPVGQKTLFNSGIPAANGSTQMETELWIRIDTLPKAKQLSLFDNKYIQTSQIYEI